jgi:H+/gluconate symporter-like permease
MLGKTGFGWQLLGTLLCGLVLTIPVILGYYFYKWVRQQVERHREKTEKEQMVV